MEAKMAHNLNTQTFSFRGRTFKKGVDTYTHEESLWIIARSEKTLISYVDDNKKVIYHGELPNPRNYLDSVWNRILVGKRGKGLGCIIYLGAK